MTVRVARQELRILALDFDEDLVPEELTQVQMGKIIRDKYPELDAEDQEAVRQHAIAALNLTQTAAQVASGVDADEASPNTALIDGIRKFAMDVRQLDIDLIDRINPFGEAYAILAKTMSEESLREVSAAITAAAGSRSAKIRREQPGTSQEASHLEHEAHTQVVPRQVGQRPSVAA